MSVELVRASATDGIYLHGVLYEAPRGIAVAAALDAVICLHGVAGNFYDSAVFSQLAPVLQQRGIDVMRVNTRGHDGISAAHGPMGPRPAGAAFEVVDECRFDIEGWIAFLQQKDRRRIGLVGHSLGAIKAVYHEAVQPHAAVACVIALSPPRLSHHHFLTSEDRDLYIQTLQHARRLTDQGEAASLMRVRFPFPMHITAGSYVDKYGPAERYNIVRLVDRLKRPVLFTYGSRELAGSVAFAGVPDALQDARRADQALDVEIIEGADHAYRGRESAVVERITGWLDQTFSAGSGEKDA